MYSMVSSILSSSSLISGQDLSLGDLTKYRTDKWAFDLGGTTSSPGTRNSDSTTLNEQMCSATSKALSTLARSVIPRTLPASSLDNVSNLPSFLTGWATTTLESTDVHKPVDQGGELGHDLQLVGLSCWGEREVSGQVLGNQSLDFVESEVGEARADLSRQAEQVQQVVGRDDLGRVSVGQFPDKQPGGVHMQALGGVRLDVAPPGTNDVGEQGADQQEVEHNQDGRVLALNQKRWQGDAVRHVSSAVGVAVLQEVLTGGLVGQRICDLICFSVAEEAMPKISYGSNTVSMSASWAYLAAMKNTAAHPTSNTTSVLLTMRDDVLRLWYALMASALGTAKVEWFSTTAPGIWPFCWSGWSLEKTRNLARNVEVNGVGLFRSLDTFGPFEAQNSGVSSEPPVVGLVTSQTGAVDTRSSAGTQADHHTVFGVANRVRLGVLQSDSSHRQVDFASLGQVLVLGDDVLERRALDDGVVSLLSQGDSVNLSRLQSVWSEVGVDLKNTVLSALLLLQDLQSLGLVSWGNHTVGHFLGDDSGGGQVHNIGQCDPVAERRHSVGTSGSSVGVGQGRQVLDVLDEVDLLLGVGKRQSYGGTGWRNVLKRSGGWQVQRSRQLLDQGPRVQGVQQVDVAGRAAQHLEGVGAVSQGQLADVLRVSLSEEVGDGHVVVGGVLESLEGESVSGVFRNFAGLQFLQESSVVLWIGQDGDSGVVLGGRSQQGDTANVDLLDGLVNGDGDLGNGLFERRTSTVTNSTSTASPKFTQFQFYINNPIALSKKSHQLKTRLLSVSPQGKSVVLLPGVVTTSRGVVVSVALVDTSGLLSSSGQASGFSVLVDWVGDPVVSGVSSDGLVGWVHQDDLEVLVGGVSVDPVRVEDSQVSGSSTNSVFSDGSQRSLVFQLVHTLVGWLTVSGTLWHRSLSASSSDSDSEDDKSLLSLVAQSSGLVRSRWLGSSVNNSSLSVFPTSDSVQESHDIGSLLSLQFFQVFVGTHF